MEPIKTMHARSDVVSSTSTRPEKVTNAEEIALHIRTLYEQAVGRSDAAALGALYASDGWIHSKFGYVFKGPKEVEEYYTYVFSQWRGTLRMTTKDVTGLSDAAIIDIGSFFATGEGGEGERRSDYTWVIKPAKPDLIIAPAHAFLIHRFVEYEPHPMP